MKRRIAGEDLKAAALAVGWLFAAWRIHRRRPAPELLKRLREPAPAASHRPFDEGDAARLRWALIAAARRVPWRSDCMIQSLAARLWLDRLGVPCTFRLGAQRGPAGLFAHAWIEVDGRIVTGGRSVGGLADFVPPEDGAS